MHPSLINCLESADKGFYLDLGLHSAPQDKESGPTDSFCKIISARIATGSEDTIERVVLVKQRDRYPVPDSLVTVTNKRLDTAWQNCLAFHRQAGNCSPPMMLKHQVDSQGALQAFEPLFMCQETDQWFRPLCPQCGSALMLCQDDALLVQRGLPTYTDSLARFMVCESCVRLSDTSPLYCRQKIDGMPENVLDERGLITRWKQLLTTLPDEAELPCRGCPSVEECYGSDPLATRRIRSWGFYPFFMLMFPQPSVGATDFIRMIAGDSSLAEQQMAKSRFPKQARRFLFQDEPRQFLEVLYLKLTLLEQIVRRILPSEKSAVVQEFDLSLDGIGVDLNVPGSGLPVFWNFNARILDAVGSFQTSPFAPRLPVAPRLHFLGALWFRTLLVNARQQSTVVFAEAKHALDQLTEDNDLEQWALDTSDPASPFSVSQIFWIPRDIVIPAAWHRHWQKALRLGLHLVHAGLKTRMAWDDQSFLNALVSLRDAIHSEMLPETMVAASTASSKPVATDRLRMVLSGILKKWQARSNVDWPSDPAAAPTSGEEETVVTHGRSDISTPQEAASSEWDQDIDKTVVLTGPHSDASSEKKPQAIKSDGFPDPAWDDDGQATVIISSNASDPSTDQSSFSDDLEKTVAVSPRTDNHGQSGPVADADTEATIVQKRSKTASPSTDDEEDLDATVVINTRGQAPNEATALPSDDDLAATVVQKTGGRSPNRDSNASFGSPDDLDATVIIRPSGARTSENQPSDDDMTETLAQKSVGADQKRGQASAANASGAARSVAPQPSQGSGREKIKSPDGDDDITEQTVIIRSDVKKK